MNGIKTENAITRRLENLQTMWEQFRALPTARCCCWTIRQDEWTMMDAFYQVNADESSDEPDIFLRFETPFVSAKTYGKALVEELATIVESNKINLEEDNIIINWYPAYDEDPKNEAVVFLRNLFRFAESLDIEDRVVAYLSPTSIAHPASWEKWWMQILELRLPEKINLMVCDTIGDQKLQKPAKAHPDKMICFNPKLDMDNAIRELMNEYGDQDDNCTHFRKAFFELTQAVATKDSVKIKERTQTALALAREIDYPHLEIAVLCTAGNGFVMSGKQTSANAAFDQAYRIAEDARTLPFIKELPEENPDLPGGNLFDQLAVQTLFYKAVGYISSTLPNYEEALKIYQQAEAKLLQMSEEKEARKKEIIENRKIPVQIGQTAASYNFTG